MCSLTDSNNDLSLVWLSNTQDAINYCIGKLETYVSNLCQTKSHVSNGVSIIKQRIFVFIGTLLLTLQNSATNTKLFTTNESSGEVLARVYLPMITTELFCSTMSARSMNLNLASFFFSFIIVKKFLLQASYGLGISSLIDHQNKTNCI